MKILDKIVMSVAPILALVGVFIIVMSFFSPIENMPWTRGLYFIFVSSAAIGAVKYWQRKELHHQNPELFQEPQEPGLKSLEDEEVKSQALTNWEKQIIEASRNRKTP